MQEGAEREKNTAEDGFYRFRTILSAPYARRAPHLHLKVRGTAFDELTTQVYIAGEPRNEYDKVLNTLTDPAERKRLMVVLKPASRQQPFALAGRFDIVLGY